MLWIMRVSQLAVMLAVMVVSAPSSVAASEEQLIQACFNAVNAATKSACALCQEAADGTTGKNKTVALINLARCEASRGRLAHALVKYREVRGLMAPDDDRVAAVDAQILDLEARVGRLRLDWSTLPVTATLALDDEAVDGRPAELTVAPGERALVVALDGHEPWTTTVTLAEGGATDVVLQAGPPLPEPATEQPERVVVDDGPHPQWIAGYALGAVGIAGAVAFGVTGALALDRQATVDELCPQSDAGRVCTDPAGIEAADEGKTLNVVNAVSLAVGGAALVTGLVLILTAPDDEAAVGLAPLGPGMMLWGRF